MAKNENGIPFSKYSDCPCASGGIVGGVSDGSGGCQNGCGSNGCGLPDSENGGSVGGAISGECGGRGDCLDGKPLAYVYAPDQRFRMLYSASEALRHGTLFEELYKPKGVYGNE
ncbi:MAG: spore coat associated protein CotJA [Clostridia bacterium]|nr:spore coat associated protein CotJA [Clostridia bacterium]